MRHSITGALLALAMTAALAQDVISPNPNLLADGIPLFFFNFSEKFEIYTEFRGYGFVGWHPVERSMLVRHREQGANIAQVYWLKSPGGKLEKITDFPDPVSSASFAPHHGNYIVYGRDAGGNEATQIFRMDLATKQSTLLSNPDERSAYTWSKKGDKVLIPVRSGAGLRLGINGGYMKFSRKQNWFPF